MKVYFYSLLLILALTGAVALPTQFAFAEPPVALEPVPVDASRMADLIKAGRKPELLTQPEDVLSKLVAKDRDADAAFELAARLLPDAPTNPEAQKMLKVATAKLHPQALRILLMVSQAQSRRDKANETRLLTQLISTGDVSAQQELCDLNVDGYWMAAPPLSPKFSLEKPDPKFLPFQFNATLEMKAEVKADPNKPQELTREEIIARRAAAKKKTAPPSINDAPREPGKDDAKPAANDGGTYLHPTGYGKSDTVKVKADLSRVSKLPLANGRSIKVAGYVDTSGVFQVMAAIVPEAKFTYTYQLEKHAVIGGAEQKWDVDVTVRNTGQQAIRNAKFSVRLFQAGQSRVGQDLTNKETVPLVPPGKTVTIKSSFVMYNYEWAAGSGVPSVEVTKGDFDW